VQGMTFPRTLASEHWYRPERFTVWAWRAAFRTRHRKARINPRQRQAAIRITLIRTPLTGRMAAGRDTRTLGQVQAKRHPRKREPAYYQLLTCTRARNGYICSRRVQRAEVFCTLANRLARSAERPGASIPEAFPRWLPRLSGDRTPRNSPRWQNRVQPLVLRRRSPKTLPAA